MTYKKLECSYNSTHVKGSCCFCFQLLFFFFEILIIMVSLQPSLSSLQALPVVLPCSLWNSWLEEGCMNIWRLSCLLWILLCSREAVFLLLIRIPCGIFRTCHFMSSFSFRKNCLFTFTACFDASRLHLLACCGGFLLIFKRVLHFFNIIFSLLPRLYVLIVT